MRARVTVRGQEHPISPPLLPSPLPPAPSPRPLPPYLVEDDVAFGVGATLLQRNRHHLEDLHTCTYMYVCMYVCMHVCMYVHHLEDLRPCRGVRVRGVRGEGARGEGARYEVRGARCEVRGEGEG